LNAVGIAASRFRKPERNPTRALALRSGDVAA
jgi:hypothetical protein